MAGPAKITSPIVKCDGHPGLPKYVFVLSLENRSFDHLFGRSGISGKNAADKTQTVGVEGVLRLGANGLEIDPKYTNTYENGTPIGIPNRDAQWIMPSDPKHEFEHILCQTCGPDACKTLFTTFKAGPSSFKTNDIPDSFYNTVPPPPQSQPQFVRLSAAVKGAINEAPSPPARPAPDNSGFVHSYVRSFTTNKNEMADNTPDTAATCDTKDEVMCCFNTASQLPILNQLAINYLICDNFFSSLPGPTGPNRFFMMAGSSAGYDGGPTSSDMKSWSTTSHLPVTNGNIFTQLNAVGVPFQVFGDDNFPMAGVMEGVHSTNTFDVHVNAVNEAAGTDIATLQTLLKEATDKNPYPFNFTWIEPDYDVASSMVYGFRHPMYSTGNSMHPCSDVRKAEMLIADIYNWIAGNPSVWNNCVFFITWDEHGGFYDHVPSPTAPAPGDSPSKGRTWGFDFTRLGTRVPCLIISPFIHSNLVDKRLYHHGSILRCVVDLNNAGAFTKDGKPPAKKMPYWTQRISDSKAAAMINLFTQDPAVAKAVALGTPLEPAAVQTASNDQQPSNDEPSGNTPVFLASAMNLHQSADPSMDYGQTASTLTTNKAASAYFDKAAKAVDDKQAATKTG